MLPSDTVAKRPFTSTSLMLPCYTKRQPSHNLVYTVDDTFVTVARNSYEHSHIHLRMLTVLIQSGNFKHFKTSVGCTR